jgi:hypothetical protein
LEHAIGDQGANGCLWGCASRLHRIMIGAEPRGPALPGDGLVEHAAERWPVDGGRLHTEANDPPGD